MSLHAMDPAALLILPFLLGAAIGDEGVVLKIGVLPNENEFGALVHTWYQQAPHTNRDVFYKLECRLSKTIENQFLVKLYFKDSVLETMLVSRFDYKLLQSITVYKRDEKKHKHRIKYKMAKSSGSSCRARMYEPVHNEFGKFTPTENSCGWFRNFWGRPGKGWRWDESIVKVIPMITEGAVGELGLLRRKDEGERLHTWRNRKDGYKLTIRRVADGQTSSYLATITYKDTVLDVLEIFRLGNILNDSITVVGLKKGTHVIQYQKTNRKCQRVEYRVPEGGEVQSKLLDCQFLFLRGMSIMIQQMFLMYQPGNGWIW